MGLAQKLGSKIKALTDPQSSIIPQDRKRGIGKIMAATAAAAAAGAAATAAAS
jgi:hypothetical protein